MVLFRPLKKAKVSLPGESVESESYMQGPRWWGEAGGAVAPPTFWEMKYFLPQKIMTVETKSSTTYSGPLTVQNRWIY